MNKLKTALVIALLIVLVLGVAGVLVGTILGANPIQVGRTIFRETAERGNFDLFKGTQSLTASSTALAP